MSKLMFYNISMVENLTYMFIVSNADTIIFIQGCRQENTNYQNTIYLSRLLLLRF